MGEGEGQALPNITTELAFWRRLFSPGWYYQP
jgi:hypothetical protein